MERSHILENEPAHEVGAGRRDAAHHQISQGVSDEVDEVDGLVGQLFESQSDVVRHESDRVLAGSLARSVTTTIHGVDGPPGGQGHGDLLPVVDLQNGVPADEGPWDVAEVVARTADLVDRARAFIVASSTGGDGADSWLSDPADTMTA